MKIPLRKRNEMEPIFWKKSSHPITRVTEVGYYRVTQPAGSLSLQGPWTFRVPKPAGPLNLQGPWTCTVAEPAWSPDLEGRWTCTVAEPVGATMIWGWTQILATNGTATLDNFPDEKLSAASQSCHCRVILSSLRMAGTRTNWGSGLD